MVAPPKVIQPAPNSKHHKQINFSAKINVHLAHKKIGSVYLVLHNLFGAEPFLNLFCLINLVSAIVFGEALNENNTDQAGEREGERLIDAEVLYLCYHSACVSSTYCVRSEHSATGGGCVHARALCQC
jgi:hypothetical protein